MPDVLIPTWLKCAKVGFRYLDSTGISRPEFSGIIRTASRGGDRLGATLEFTPTATSSAESAQERRALLAFLGKLQGRQNRAYLTNPARRLAGSFPAAELLTNNAFQNGTTGWTADNCTLVVADGSARMTVTTPAANVQIRQSLALTQYAPHVLRGFIMDGPQTAGLNIGPSLALGASYSSQGYSSIRGLKTVSGVAHDATARNQFPVVFSSVSGFTAGAHLTVPYTSLSRCALVDGGPNLLLQSDDFTTTWLNTRSTDAANSTTAPDGTSTADSIIEDATASNSHEIQQAVTVASTTELDYAFTVALKAGTRTFAQVLMVESTSSHICYIDVNLSNGATGTATVTGANWASPRAFVRSLGNGWYAVTIVGRKVSAGTTLTPIIRLATSLGGTSYSGDGSSLIYAWRATLAQSSVPTRLRLTTTAAAAAESQTGGAMYVKGLPVSTNGLLLPGDEFEVITSYGSELKIVTAPLNSDAAGLGYLEFSPPLRGAPADNAPIIIHEPMGRFVFTGDLVGWDHEPGIVTRASAEFEETA